MKKLMLVVAFATLACACVNAEALYIPASSEDHLTTYTLKEGEVVYKTVGDNYATLLIGNDTKRPYYLCDQRALKSENIYMTLESSAITVEKADVATYENGTYLITNTHSAIDPDATIEAPFIITVPQGYIINNITFDNNFLDNHDGIGERTLDTPTTKIDKNVAVLNFKIPFACEVKLWNFRVTVKTTEDSYVNNTLTSGDDFIIKDKGYTTENHGSAVSGSTYRLSDLRSWVANLFKGDLGRDWYKYPAPNDVTVSTALRWNIGDLAFTGFRTEADDKLSMYYNGKRAYYLTESITEGVTNDYSDAYIAITGIDVNNTNNNCIIKFDYTDIPSADLSKFQLMYTPTLEKDSIKWTYIDPLSITQTVTGVTNSVVITTAKTYVSGGSMGFWKIVYDSLSSVTTDGSTIIPTTITPQMVIDNVDLIVTSKVVLQSPNGSFFALSVTDDGVLKVKEYEPKVNLSTK